MGQQHLINRTPVVHVIHHGDTLTPLTVALYPAEGNTPIDLTGKSVEFYMVDSGGAEVVTQSATGITIDGDPTTGIVSKTFVAGDVAAVGVFYAYFVVISGGKEDTYPPDARRLIVQIQGDISYE